jgi:Integrase core domain/HTH-like domain
VLKVFNDNYRVYGARKGWRQLRREGVVVGRDRVARLMRSRGIAGAVRGKTCRTTIADPAATRAPDLVQRRFVATRPNQLWVSDFTYVASWSGTVYMAVVIDVFSRLIVGWRAATTMRTELVLDALEMAIWRRASVLEGLICHSDAGSQAGFKGSSQQPERWGVDGTTTGWAAVATGRPPMRSPGRPPVARREHRQRFWKAIALGLSSEDAAVVCGVSQAGGPGGSVNVAACHRSVWLRCRAATYRSPSARRSPSSRPRAAGLARSLGGSAGRRRRSRVSCAATPRTAAASWTVAPRPRSGTPIGVPGARSWPSSPPTTRCASMCRTGLAA